MKKKKNTRGLLKKKKKSKDKLKEHLIKLNRKMMIQKLKIHDSWKKQIHSQDLNHIQSKNQNKKKRCQTTLCHKQFNSRMKLLDYKIP